MPLLPAEPISIVGFGLIGATIWVLVATDWPKAYVLGASSIVLFGVQFLDQLLFGAPLGLFGLALVPETLIAGDWWSPVTYAFLHGSLFHIFGNLFILLTAGPALEDSVGPSWFLGIYAAGALAAAAAGVGLSMVDAGAASIGLPASTTPMVGSSGAIFAVLTAFAVRHPRAKLPIPFYIILWLPAMMVLLIFLAMNLGYIFLDTNVAWYGHFAGFIAGLAIASLPIEHGEGTSAESVDVDDLTGLATTERAKNALSRLSELEEGEEDVAAAWLDELADEATCPVCESTLERRDLTVVCPNGHALDTGADPLEEDPAASEPARPRE